MEQIFETRGQAAARKGKVICAICEREIKANAKHAEFSNTDGEWYAKGVPEGHESTGWYDIGSDCFNRNVNK